MRGEDVLCTATPARPMLLLLTTLVVTVGVSGALLVRVAAARRAAPGVVPSIAALPLYLRLRPVLADASDAPTQWHVVGCAAPA